MKAPDLFTRRAAALAIGILGLTAIPSHATDFDEEGIEVDGIKYGIIGTEAPYSAYVVETDMFEDDFEYEGDIVIPETIEFAAGKTATVTGIDKRAFYSTYVTSVSTPNTVSYIGNQAFALCSKLTSVTLGTGVTEIGSKAFSPDANLTTVFCNAAVPPAIAADALMNNVARATLYVPASSIDAYKEAEVWKSFGTITSRTDYVAVTEVIVTPSQVNVPTMGTVRLSATVLPAEAEQKVTWMSSNKAVASVSSNGEVFGVKDGICIVTAYAADGSGIKGECVVTVGAGKKLELSTPAISGYVGDRFSVSAMVSPEDTTVEWTVEDPEIVMLEANGLTAEVALIGKGVTTLTATASNGLSASVRIDVSELIPLTGISVDPEEIECEVGDIISLMEFNVQPVPEDVSVFDPTVSIEDNTILDYSPDDIDMETFECLKEGTTRLVWTQGDIKGYCTVIVKDPFFVGVKDISGESVDDDARIYSIDGCVVNSTFDALLPGCYIVNRKLVVKK